MGDVVLGADLFKPLGSSSAGCDDRLFGIYFFGVVLFADVNSLTNIAVENDVGAFVAEKYLHPVVQKPMLKSEIQILCLFGSEMADGTVHEFKSRLNGTLADFLDLVVAVNAFNVFVGTEFEIYFVGIINGFLSKILPDKGGQVSADLVA